MAKKLAEDVDELVRVAQDDVPQREHRYVYSESSTSRRSGYAIRPNKKAVGRKVSTFYLIALLFGVGVAIVGYINNIIVVNTLSSEINLLQIQYDKISNRNAMLRAEIDGKSGRDRIGKIAAEQVGLREPKEPPTAFDVDEELMQQAQENAQTK
jgi:cell division protein FtsB